LLPLAAAAGLAFAGWRVAVTARPVPAAPPVAAPSVSPFPTFIAGAGLIEASSENIAIGSPVGGTVVAVLVEAGAVVKAGDPLFRLDDRSQRAEALSRRTRLVAVRAQRARLAAMPRSEDLPPVVARLAAAAAQAADARQQLGLYEAVTDARAIAVDDLNRRRAAVLVAAANVAQAEADLASMKAGAWAPDLVVADAQIAEAEAAVSAAEVEVARLTVVAPIAGQVLSVKVRPGEYATPGALATPLVLLGAVDPLHVRVDIDEHDAWRLKPGAKAVANLRGNSRIAVTLEWVRAEPYVVPKRSLTGDSVERVDTRVLQAIFRFRRGDQPLFVGQQLDVFIDAPPIVAAPVVTP